MYIKINPISIDLFSDTEKEQMCRTLTAELSSARKPFKFLAVSRPVDISPLINEYTQLLSETNDQKQKELLRNEMMVMSNYAISGKMRSKMDHIYVNDKIKLLKFAALFGANASGKSNLVSAIDFARETIVSKLPEAHTVKYNKCTESNKSEKSYFEFE
ncbi:MAG: hypothetical protein U9Q80_00730, partial [Bacillota bacterium]|nr:hypothetical protein [Bacillota bacterium]